MNTDSTRPEISETLAELMQAAPHLRAAQIVAMAGEICHDLHGRGLWDADDREFLEALWKLQRDLTAGLPAASAVAVE